MNSRRLNEHLILPQPSDHDTETFKIVIIFHRAQTTTLMYGNLKGQIQQLT